MAQKTVTREATPEALTALRSQLARIHATRANASPQKQALPDVVGGLRSRAAEAAFGRWLAIDPSNARALVNF